MSQMGGSRGCSLPGWPILWLWNDFNDCVAVQCSSADEERVLNGQDLPRRERQSRQRQYRPPHPARAAFLRETLRLTGTHVGCDTSQCGACVVHVDGKAVKSCTTLALSCEGASVVTIEGLANGAALHPMQEAFRDNHGLQCGFCTPGMIMTAVDMVNRKGHDLDEHTVREELEGNICRCTGYHNIVKSVRPAARPWARAEPALAFRTPETKRPNRGQPCIRFKYLRQPRTPPSPGCRPAGEERRGQAARRRADAVADHEEPARQPSSLIIDLNGIDRSGRIEVKRGSLIIKAMTRHFDGGQQPGRTGRACRALPTLPAASAILPCAIAAPSADRSPTTIRRRTIRRPVWRSARPSSPTGARCRPRISSGHVLDRSGADGEIITRIAFPTGGRFAYAKFPNPASRYAAVGVAVAKGRGKTCASRSPALAPSVCSAVPRARKRPC